MNKTDTKLIIIINFLVFTEKNEQDLTFGKDTLYL